MSQQLENGSPIFGVSKRPLIRIKGATEREMRADISTPNREDQLFSRNKDSRRGLSRNSRQTNKPQVSWLKGKTSGANSLHEMFEGDFKSINLALGDDPDTNIPQDDQNPGIQRYFHNPDEFR
jgi:hypothetical protein